MSNLNKGGVAIIDFGSQYTQLIARRVREQFVFSEIYSPETPFDEIIKSGDWSSMLAWLRDKIHLKGSVMTPAELIESATGSPPSPEPFLAYVEAKYSKLYNL